MSPELIWLIVFVVFLIIELATISFGAIFISVSALVCLILCSLFDLSFKIQLTVFSLLSLIGLFGFRNVIKKKLNIRSENTADDIEKDPFVGEPAVAEEDGEKGKAFPARVNGTFVSLISETSVKKGQTLKIVRPIKKGQLYYAQPLDDTTTSNSPKT